MAPYDFSTMIPTLIMIGKVLLSVLLGAIIGYEREMREKPAGLRTHILLATGSTVFTILSTDAFPGSESARVAAGIVAGVGFIGAGAIFMQKDKVIGITTAASLWVTASIGMAVATGFYILGVATTLITYIILRLPRTG
jgi:putative Mg2+ transporter-C (MgtC) family protein